MRSLTAVVSTPGFDRPLRVCEIHEPALIQALVPKRPVQALNESVPDRLPVVDEVEHDYQTGIPRRHLPDLGMGGLRVPGTGAGPVPSGALAVPSGGGALVRGGTELRGREGAVPDHRLA